MTTNIVDNRRERQRRLASPESEVLAGISSLTLKAKLAAGLMDQVPPCVSCGAATWTTDPIRHFRSVKRGATADNLVCDTCFDGVRLDTEAGT